MATGSRRGSEITLCARGMSGRAEHILATARDQDAEIFFHEGRSRRVGVLVSPRLVDAVLGHGARMFEKGAGTQYWRALIGDGTGIRPPLQTLKVSSSAGRDLASWRAYRRRSMAEFFSRRNFASYRAASQLALARQFDLWQADPDRDLIDDSRTIALAIFTECFVGSALATDLARASDVIFATKTAVKKAVDSSWMCPFDRSRTPADKARQLLQMAVVPGSSGVRRRADALSAVFAEVAKRVASNSDRTLFSALASAAAGYRTDIPARGLASQLQGLFIAGTETIAAGFLWLLWHVIEEPELQERLALEAQTGSDRLLSSCVWESLRLHPPAWSIPREAMRPMRVGREVLDPGTVLIASPLIQHLDSSAHPDAEDFRPNRFMVPPRFDGRFYPFSLGPRTCPAMGFAHDQLVAVTREILLKWRLEASGRQPALEHWLGVDLSVPPGARYRFTASRRCAAR